MLTDTKFHVARSDRMVEIYHLGYRPGRDEKERTTDDHGPMEDVDEKLDGRTVIECPQCSWRGDFTTIASLGALEVRRGLQQRNSALNKRIAPFYEQAERGKISTERAGALTNIDRREYDANEPKIAELRKLEDYDVIGAKFSGRHSGSLILKLLPEALPDPVRVADREKEEAPA
jgi:hypothetical protein